MIDRFERFSLAISEVSRYWHKISSDEMEKQGLKGTHSVYLLTMLRFPEGISATNLGELCGKGKSDVSRMMAIMEKKGLVFKEGVHKNCYRGVFKLTSEGIKIAELIKNRASLAVGIAGKDLSDKKREIFYEAIEIIIKNLKVLAEDGVPQN